MTRTTFGLFLSLVILASAGPVLAQGVDVGVIATGLISVATESSYAGGEGSTYLDDGLGGKGPGFGVSLDASAPNGFTGVVEFSSARMKAVQRGRIIGGGPVTTTLNDAMLIGMIGWAKGDHHRFTILAGGGRLFGTPSMDGEPIVDTNIDNRSRLVLTAGLNAAHHLSSRVSLVGTARYSKLTRTSRADELGISDHIYRFGAGLRIRLSH